MKNFGKWICLTILAALLLAATGCDNKKNTTKTPTDEKGLAIDGEHFPDELLRAAVSESFDKNGDGKLSDAEIRSATVFDLGQYAAQAGGGSSSTHSLAGLEYLTELNELRLNGVKLDQLKLSGLTNLTVLVCDNCDLTQLELSNLPSFSTLSCKKNQLTKLDLQGVDIISLDCSDNRIEELDIQNSQFMQTLYINGNPLPGVDLRYFSNFGEQLSNPVSDTTDTVRVVKTETGTVICDPDDILAHNASSRFTVYIHLQGKTFENGASLEPVAGLPVAEPQFSPSFDIYGHVIDGIYYDAECTKKVTFPITVTENVELYARYVVAPEYQQ